MGNREGTLSTTNRHCNHRDMETYILSLIIIILVYFVHYFSYAFTQMKMIFSLSGVFRQKKSHTA